MQLRINNKKGEATRQNIQLTNIRTDYINKTVHELVKQKPSFIAIEDLNASINLIYVPKAIWGINGCGCAIQTVVA